MLSFNFRVVNPFSRRWGGIYSRTWKLSQNKRCEFEVLKCNYIIGLTFEWSIREDHAGLTLGLKLLGLWAEFIVYDIRHWDVDREEWVSEKCEEM